MKKAQKKKAVKKSSRSKSSEKKIVAINCIGAGQMAIHLLTPLQGALKTLHEANYLKLKKVLSTEGITEPISIWEDPATGKTMILNGHQRVHTLQRMRDEEGFVIPQIPVNVVTAKDIKHAKRLVLQLTSQYGTINPDSAFEFINELGVSSDEISSMLNFADFDMTAFLSQYFEETKIETEPEPEEEKIDVSAHERVKNKTHTCPECGHEFS